MTNSLPLPEHHQPLLKRFTKDELQRLRHEWIDPRLEALINHLTGSKGRSMFCNLTVLLSDDKVCGSWIYRIG